MPESQYGDANGKRGDNELEMMVLKEAAEAIKQNYIEKPSSNSRSFFGASLEDITFRKGQDIPMTGAIFMMIFAFIAFGITTITFKAVYFNYRHTIWEDIYGRGVCFFICSVIQYVSSDSGTQSIFDLRKTIRAQLFLRVFLISAAYIFLFLAIEWSSSFLYVALILCVLPVACKIAQRYTLLDKNYSSWEMLVFLCAIIGMVFLFRSESNFVNKNQYIKD